MTLYANCYPPFISVTLQLALLAVSFICLIDCKKTKTGRVSHRWVTAHLLEQPQPVWGSLHQAWISSWRRMLGERKPRAAEDAKEIIGRMRTSWEQAAQHILSRLEPWGLYRSPYHRNETPASSPLLSQLTLWRHPLSRVKGKGPLGASLTLPSECCQSDLWTLCDMGVPQWLLRLPHPTDRMPSKGDTESLHPLLLPKKYLHHSHYNSVLINNIHVTHQLTVSGDLKNRYHEIHLITHRKQKHPHCAGVTPYRGTDETSSWLTSSVLADSGRLQRVCCWVTAAAVHISTSFSSHFHFCLSDTKMSFPSCWTWQFSRIRTMSFLNEHCRQSLPSELSKMHSKYACQMWNEKPTNCLPPKCHVNTMLKENI